MNWSDLLVIGVIVLFALIGLKNGFIMSVFRLTSFIVSAIVSIKFYPIVSKFLMGTPIYKSIKTSIFNNLMLQQQAQSPGVNSQVKDAAADSIINTLHTPAFIKGFLVKQMPDPTSLIPIKDIAEKLSGILADFSINVISVVVLFILVRIGLLFVRFIFKKIAGLPVFKQMDKVGGLALGAIEGLLMIYVIFAVIIIFNSAPIFKGIYDSIDNSTVAQYFYQNNLIIDWMLPKD